MYVLDTNVIIYFLKGDEGVKNILMEAFFAAPIFVSSVTEIELLAYPRLTAEEETTINSFLNGCVLVPVDSRVARLAAVLKRDYGLGLADSIIAATAATTHSTLATRNITDFKKVANLKLKKV